MDKLSNTVFDQDLLLLHGDLVFPREVLNQLIHQYQKSMVVVDQSAPIPEKDFKARLNTQGLVGEIGVHVFGPQCVACQPLYVLRKEDWAIWTNPVPIINKRLKKLVQRLSPFPLQQVLEVSRHSSPYCMSMEKKYHSLILH